MNHDMNLLLALVNIDYSSRISAMFGAVCGIYESVARFDDDQRATINLIVPEVEACMYACLYVIMYDEKSMD
jgi:hypothetical protein